MRGHGRALSKIFGIGFKERTRNKSRCQQNLSSWAKDAPVMRATAKTHKPPGRRVPKSRPIVGASKGLTTPLGELFLDLVEPVSRMDMESREARSTENVLKIGEENLRMKSDQVKDIDVGSMMDVVALYPSIDQEEATKVVAEEIVSRAVKYWDFDDKTAGINLGTMWTK